MCRTLRNAIAAAAAALLAWTAPPASAAVPGSIEVTCDVDRAAFRSAARLLPAGGSVTFHVFTAPTGGTETGYNVLLADLQVFKAFTEKYDSVNKRKAARVEARIGTAEPVNENETVGFGI
jgi:hypothetical protein